MSAWLLLAGCATLPRSATVYPFQRPVMGTAGTVLPITDAHWAACDGDADRETVRTAQQNRTALYSLAGGGGLIGGAIGGYFAAKELEKPETAAQQATNAAVYERLMRACLVNQGYAITVPPAPSRRFDP